MSLLAAVLLFASSAAVRADDDDDDDDGVSSRLITYQDRPAIRLEEEMQEQVAIRTARLEGTALSQEELVVGEVVDITPLLEQRSLYLDLRSNKQQAAAALKVSAAAVDRLSALQSMDNNVSKRELQSAQLQHERETIRLDTLNRQLENRRRIMRREWGDVLADWATGAEAESLSAIAEGQSALIRVRLPFPGKADPIYMNDTDDRTRAYPARYVSAATRAAADRRGNTHYYRAQAEALRGGMRLYAWVPLPEREVEGVVLPLDAIVWFNGRPWFYLKMDETIFVKRMIDEHIVSGRGWLVPEPDLAGAEVVTQGAQLLLSEEYRWQIPDEDDDP